MKLRIVLLVLIIFILVLPSFVLATVAHPPSETPTTASGTCLDGSNQGTGVPLNVSVAFVKPIFTSTPYSQYNFGSFYAFYHKYHGASGNITTDLNWLNTSVRSGTGYNMGWGHTWILYSFVASQAARNCGLVLGKNVKVISDINVTDGALFDSNGKRMFDAVVIGHQEYVTQAEYDQFRRFVATGGRLVAMSSNEFYAKVKFNPKTLMETFVVGHGGFAYNGRTAWYGNNIRTPWNTSGWFGSVYCCFHRFRYNGATINATNPIGSILNRYFEGVMAKGYTTHEENAISNFTHSSIVATFTRTSGLTVASYVHWFGKGAVVCFCVFGEDLIGNEKPTQLFLVESLAPFTIGKLAVSPPAATSPYLLSVAVVLTLVVLAGVAFVIRRYGRRRRFNKSP